MHPDSFEVLEHNNNLPSSGFWSMAAYRGGQYGVIIAERGGDVSMGIFVPESKLAAVIADLPVQYRSMVRWAASRINVLRARMEAS